MVRTPSPHALRSPSTTSASTRPARAIISISWSVLRLIMPTATPAGDGPEEPGPDLFDAARAVHVADDMLLPVVRQDRQGLLEVHGDSPPRRLGTVVLAHHEL